MNTNMMNMNVQNLMEYQLQQQIAYEFYRQQITQRLPDPFMQMLPLMPMPTALTHTLLPAQSTLPGCVTANLENNALWRQFHDIGTEMIITKNGRRMFPSVSLSLKGLEPDEHYCVLLEMLPIGECRFKYSGSQWIPAGGAEPQSPQRIFLHPDSPSSGAHWESQSISFNKIKLTNNTLDNNGHIVLASMHKYQPRLHVIKTKDLTQLAWAPQQSFVFPETEFIAVTAYQNDRITKLKIDNNPFAKGFRESGQSKCKRKLMASNSYCSSSPSSPMQCLDDTEDDNVSITSADTLGKKMRIATSNTNICNDSIYEQFPMNQFYLKPSLPYMDFITRFNTNQNDMPANASMYNDSYINSSNQLPNQLPPACTSSTNNPSTNYPDKTTSDYSRNTTNNPCPINNTNNGDILCLEATTVSPKSSSNTKKSNFSISAILAY